MTKTIGVLVALAMFCAIPGVAFAQIEVDPPVLSDTVGDEATQNNSTGQNADADDGNAANQNATCQQISGGNSNCSINQSQEQNIVRGDVGVGGDDDGVSGDDDGVGGDDDGVGGDDDGVSGDDDGVTGDGGVGGGVESVTLARTGFDAWVLALVGGLALAGGLALLVAQRRGRIGA